MPEPMAESASSDLVRDDAAHLIHPLHSPLAHEQLGPIILRSGHGATVTDIAGREYIDGLSSLWNVNCGHGRQELAQAAADQMARLGFCSSYAGLANEPAIRLATRLSELAYPRLNAVFFASGGAEANESAFKLARSYWKLRGQPQKTKIIARRFAYHGVTIATMSATGMPAYWPLFEPRAPGFVHVAPPYCYRCEFGKTPDACQLECAASLEEAILREGPDTVAAFIAEPVQGAGGVIVPPDAYFPAIRDICDRHGVLFVADEVITGFGRTGRMFALERWGVEPDIMAFAKGVTSAYLPLGGIIMSDEIASTLRSLPPDQAWMHAYTYSGHPTCCAVALRNLEIIESEGLVARAEEMGQRLLDGLRTLQNLPAVGEVRGLGLMAAVELVADRRTRESYPASARIGPRCLKAAAERGVLIRVRGDVLMMAPPLVIAGSEIDRLVNVVGEAIATTTAA